MLAFEPMDYRALLGTPRRADHRRGRGDKYLRSAPDHGRARPATASSGSAFVNGRGEVMKTGGRVMKNVTGLDLVKLLAGSWGTLGILTEVTFKVLPRPETMATLLWRGLADAEAVDALSQRLGHSLRGHGRRASSGAEGQSARTLVRLEGFSRLGRYRLGEVGALAGALARRYARRPRCRDSGRSCATPPFCRRCRASRLAHLHGALQGTGPPARIARPLDARWFYDWGGGLVWMARGPKATPGPSSSVRRGIRRPRDAGARQTTSRACTPFEPRSESHGADARRQGIVRSGADFQPGPDVCGDMI